MSDPLEKVLFDTLAIHWMSATDGVCTCGEVMYTERGRDAIKGVTQHRARVIAEVIETKWYPIWKKEQQ